MITECFDEILSPDAERPALQAAWLRQRETAREFCRRFEEGSDTQLLGDEVGMGKTYVALAVMANAVLQPGGQGGAKALLVTPPSAVLRSKWEQEIRSFSSRYVGQGASGTMKPLIVNSFWDLVANLHDHEDVAVSRIHEPVLQAILLQLWRWAQRKGWQSSRAKPWREIKNFDGESPQAMRFVSDYSMAAFEAYLEKTNADGNDFLHAMLRPGGDLYRQPETSKQRIKQLFRDFAQRQDSFEPNIFILGMNSLRKPNSNKWQNQRFATFVLSVLLKGRWLATCNAVIEALKETNLLQGTPTKAHLERLASVDLYRTRHCVTAVLDNDALLRAQWDQIVATPDAVSKQAVRNFFARTVDATVAYKLAESGIRLAVVDEVHNWKSGANGASDFEKNFASSIDHKLLMSATPFQLAEGEMCKVIGFAMKPGGPTHEVLDRLFGPARLVKQCLDANQAFLGAWSKLPLLEATQLVAVAQAGSDSLALRQALEALQSDSTESTTLRHFCACAIAYREAVDGLLMQQRKIMIRHVKSRGLRRFHAGRDYMTSELKARTALYMVGGLAAPADTFANFLAMRLDQRIRREANKAAQERSNAHLARGISSSRAAFLESRENQGHHVASLSGATQGYLQLFGDALARSPHPKVSATVALALENYLHGRKTLIFCERVASVGEIAQALREGIERSLGRELPRVAEMRTRLLRNHLFADMQWYRSWRRLHPSRVDVHDPGVRLRAVTYVRSCMGTAPVTQRRVLRLLDLWFLREECRASSVPPTKAMHWLSELATAMESSYPALRQVLNVSTEVDAAEDDLTDSIDDVLDHGFFSGTNLWVDTSSTRFDFALWTLIDDEAEQIAPSGESELEPEKLMTFYNILLGLQTGLRKVALRQDLLRRCLPPSEGMSDAQAVCEGVQVDRGGGSSVWQKIVRFLDALAEADGTINTLNRTNTRRRSLWRGVELKEDKLVAELDGRTDAESRVLWCAAFNSPLAPDVLICTAIGSEGIDLHKECAQVIHHDLPWNPARMEQRIGRVDRVGSLAECSAVDIRIGIPFLANNYDQFQYDKLLSRAQLFEVLLGTPDFDVVVDEEDYANAGEGDVQDVRELDVERDATSEAALPVLPDNVVNWLRIDLSLAASAKDRTTACAA